jgi:spore maturation protein CgeB
MGHEVCTLGQIHPGEPSSTSGRAMTMAWTLLSNGRPRPTERRTLARARRFQPDAILALTADFHSETVADLSALCSGRCVLWWGDAPANSRRWGILDPGWTAVFLKDRDAVRKLRMAGRNAILLHEAMNPTWHRPVADRSHDSVAVVGNSYAYRQALVLRLMGNGVSVELFGPRPPWWADTRILATHKKVYLTREAKSRVFGEAMACLNTFSLAEGNSLNCRAFEIAGAAGLQFIEYRPAIEECFDPGRELLTFSHYEELLDHVNRARAAPRDMNAIRQAGARRALAEHTYEQRLARVLETLDGRAR